MGQGQLVGHIALNGLLAAAAGVVLVIYRGGLTLPFMVVGAFPVLFYTFRLEYVASGEIAPYLVWGPFMAAVGTRSSP
jgi:1,4-dihydroxy-2-naphthoate octaprenyltransferase